MLKLLRLDFLPLNADLGLLLLRLLFGGSMLWLHGKDKLMNFSTFAEKFPPYIVNSQVTLGFAIFGEFVCAALLIIGLFGRFAAAGLAITMAVAFFVAHKGVLTGEHSGEPALLYLIPFAALIFTGMGRYSVDKK